MAEPAKTPLTTKEATDRIVAYLGKLNDFELGRISSRIRQVRKARKEKTQLNFGLDEPADTTKS